MPKPDKSKNIQNPSASEKITPGSAEGDLKTIEEDLRQKDRLTKNKKSAISDQPAEENLGVPDQPLGTMGIPRT